MIDISDYILKDKRRVRYVRKFVSVQDKKDDKVSSKSLQRIDKMIFKFVGRKDERLKKFVC